MIKTIVFFTTSMIVFGTLTMIYAYLAACLICWMIRFVLWAYRRFFGGGAGHRHYVMLDYNNGEYVEQ